MAEITRLANIERSKKFLARLKKCERLNELIKADNEEIPDSMIDRPDFTTRANPFFIALEAQKKEREKYKQLLQLAIQSEAQLSEDQTPIFIKSTKTK